MMQGMAGLVRSRQSVWLTPKEKAELEATTGLPLDPGGNACADVDIDRCEDAGAGRWETVPGNPEVTFMHAALLPQRRRCSTGATRALTPAGSMTMGLQAATPHLPTSRQIQHPQARRIRSDSPTSGPRATHSSQQQRARCSQTEGSAEGTRQALLFHPATNLWELTNPTADGRFYATTLTLADGKLLTLYGSPLGGGTSTSIEMYTLGRAGQRRSRSRRASVTCTTHGPTYCRTGICSSPGPTGMTRRFAPLAPVVDDPARRWPTIAGNRSSGGEKGTRCSSRCGHPTTPRGSSSRAGTSRLLEQTAEIIDLSELSPAWTSVPNLSVPRPEQVNTVLLPDGRVFLAGGVPTSGGPAEIFDPDDPSAGWVAGAGDVVRPRLPLRRDPAPRRERAHGRRSAGPAGGPTEHERFFPGYFSRPRPVMTSAPGSIQHGDAFTIQTPHANAIAEVVLIQPGAVTHGFNESQRLIGCTITGSTGATVDAEAPPDGNVAPPGWYLLFVVTAGRVPSEGRWIRLRA